MSRSSWCAGKAWIFFAICVCAVRPASALTFNFTFTPESTQADIDGFNEAGAFWSSVFSDDITLNMNVGTAALSEGVLAEAGSSTATVNYSSFLTQITADSTTTTDTSALSSLSGGSSFDMLINRTSNNPNGSGSATAYLDNNGDANNSNIRLTTANARALGYTFAPGVVDAGITFGKAFDFDYDASDGITPEFYDFVGIATHEIGHALGFVSGVDILDGNSPGANGPFSDDQFVFVSPLDLFRYSAASAAVGVIDWTASSTDKYFSLDGGTTSLAGFSEGRTHGDGQQASHWKDNLGIGILDPTAATGENLFASALDLIALDAIGYDFVPEPSSGLLGLFGGLFLFRRRRK
ncbi:NF038122 family metalloprotease [Haloferula sp.]|uniref:NF038122 family metalloprotease n=1 Tax=Haloferula sp. TaxID=2497595 RepID=UPI00329C0236